MKTLERSWLEGLARGLDPDPLPDEFTGDRERCRRLGAFVEGAWHAIEPETPYLRNWHNELIHEYLEAVTAEQIFRLLITIPPRYMKSINCSVMWPIWEWTLRPSLRYMFVTYASELSKDHSNMRRAVLASPWFRDRWGTVVKVVKDDVFTVMNDRRGMFQATSFGATATGKGANRLVFDDPHNPKQAESDVERNEVVTDYGRTFATRLNDKKRDAIVTVMQRTHEMDVAAECERLGYVKLCLPCESEGRTVVVFRSGREVVREDGDLLWPEREGPAEVAAAKLALGSYGFAGQYQQRPAPAGGGLFKREWFQVVPFPPD